MPRKTVIKHKTSPKVFTAASSAFTETLREVIAQEKVCRVVYPRPVVTLPRLKKTFPDLLQYALPGGGTCIHRASRTAMVLQWAPGEDKNRQICTWVDYDSVMEWLFDTDGNLRENHHRMLDHQVNSRISWGQAMYPGELFEVYCNRQ